MSVPPSCTLTKLSASHRDELFVLAGRGKASRNKDEHCIELLVEGVRGTNRTNVAVTQANTRGALR